MRGPYEIARINDHHFNGDGALLFRVGWSYWPVAVATSVSLAELQKTGKNVLADYLTKVGANGIKDDAEFMEKMKETALSTPPVERSINVDQIIGHKIDVESEEIMFITKFSYGGNVDRPPKAFTNAYEKNILEKYLRENVTVMKATSRKPRKIGQTPVRSSARTRASKARVHPDSDSEDSGEVVATPRTSRGRPAKKRAAPASRIVSGMRQKKARHNNDAQALFIFKKNDQEQMLIIDKKGDVSLQQLDAVFEKDPKFVYEALKEAYFNKNE